MQRSPVDYDLSAAHAKKPAEIDYSSANLPAFIQDIDDATQILPGTALDILAERTPNILREQSRLPSILAVLGGRGRIRSTRPRFTPAR